MWERRHFQMTKQNTNMFAIKSPGSSFNYLNSKSKLDNSNPHLLFLLSNSCKFPILEIMTRNFIISTNSNTCHFNTYLLKKMSPLISDYIRKNPKSNHYHLDIEDEHNILVKIEQLFQGYPIVFDYDEIQFCQYIFTMLEITDIPSFLRSPNLESNLMKVNQLESNIKQTVQIQDEIFYIFLIKTAELRNFTIKTRKREYKCNIFGVYSSNIIRQAIEKNPNINEFFVNFDDEFGEFQPICDLFNFNEVELNNTNILAIKEISEQLEIKCIAKQVDDFFTKYNIFSEAIDDNQQIMNSIDNLFDLLVNIKKHSIEKVAVTIIQSSVPENEESVQELAAFILQVVKTNVFIHKEIVELLIQLNNASNENNQLAILVPFIVQKLMTFYMPRKKQQQENDHNYFGERSETKSEEEQKTKQKFSYSNYFNNYDCRFIFSFIRALYKSGFISKEEIQKKLQYYNYKNKNFNAFFLPEIIEHNPSCIDTLLDNCHNYESYYKDILVHDSNESEFNNFIKKYLPNKVDLYEKMLNEMEPDDELTKSIQNDDVDSLQSIIIKNNMKIPTQLVSYNIFDDLDEKQTILNYSALYGSTKCFKYILLNGGLIDKTTLYFAVRGNNIEIIKIVDQKLEPEEKSGNSFKNKKQNNNTFGFHHNYFVVKRDDVYENNNPLDPRIIKKVIDKNYYFLDYSDDMNIIASAILMHNNELFDWLYENIYLPKEKSENELKYLANLSASCGNAHSIVELMDRGYKDALKIITKSAKNGFLKLTELIINISGERTISLLKYSLKSLLDFQQSLEFGNLSIFKLLCQFMKQNDLEQFILYAIKMKYKKIIQYYFDNYDKIGFTQTDSFLISVLKQSLKLKTDEYFIFLFDRIKEINPNLFTINLFIDLLTNSYSYSNFATKKIITDIILEKDPTVDFSNVFYEECKIQRFDICHYFINKNVLLNYDELSTHAKEFGTIDEELFSTLISKSNPRIRFRFFRCIPHAILTKNKKLLEFIFKEKPPNGDELFLAVSTKDISMVDLVLKYNSQPSFINRKTPKGTAILISYKERSIDIFKKLLSIKDIDITLTNHSNQNCLSIALNNYDLNDIYLLLNHLGDRVQSQICFISEFLKQILKIFSNDSNKEKQYSELYQKYWKIVIRLLSIKYVDPNIYIQNHKTFLYLACFFNEINVVKSLLMIESIDVNQYESYSFNTPLIESLKNNYYAIAKILIEHPKTNINLSNCNDETALLIAVKNNLYEIVELLIKNERFDPIESRLDYCFYCSNDQSSQILISSKSLNVNQSFDLSDINDSQSKNLDFETTALIHSVEENQNKKIDLILNHQDFDKNESDINTALFVAAAKNNEIVFQKLIKLIDDDVNIKNYLDESLLLVSVNNLSCNIIQYILNVPKFDSKSSQIFESFIKLLNNNITDKELVDCDDKNLQENQNEISLPEKNSIFEIIEKIYNYDKEHDCLINLNKLIPNGKSFFTIIEKDFDQIDKVVNFLIENGADPNMPDKNSLYPLEHAIKLNSIKFIISLLNSGRIDLSQLPNGNTYLHLAVSFSNSSIFKSLLELNIFDINSTNDEGDTPLIEACKLRKTSIINLLFENENLDYCHSNNQGKNALTVIKKITDDDERESKRSKETFLEAIISLCSKFDGKFEERKNRYIKYAHEENYPVFSNIVVNNDNDNADESDDFDRIVIGLTDSYSDDDGLFIEIE